MSNTIKSDVLDQNGCFFQEDWEFQLDLMASESAQDILDSIPPGAGPRGEEIKQLIKEKLH